jgi:phosphoglycolate phosphatase-like HAD superfamily hydrolase
MRELLLTHKPVIVSSNHSALIREVLLRHGITLPIYGVEEEPSKVRKLSRLRREPALFVTDSTGDILEGKQANYVVIAVSWGFTPVDALARAKPHRLVHTPRELQHAIHTLTLGNVH